MWFYKLQYYDDLSGATKFVAGVIQADSWSHLIERLTSYYGVDDIEWIGELSPLCAPYDPLEFENDDMTSSVFLDQFKEYIW